MALLSELQHAARSLARAPGLVAVAVISLALGIGANATIFSFVNAIELRPLPFPEPGRLVDVSEDNPKELCAGCAVGTSWPAYRVWRESARSFAGLEAYREGSFALVGDGEAERVGGALTTAGLFPLFSVRPLLGRGFLPDDDRAGAPPVVLIGHGLWVRRFGSDSAVLGKTVRVNGVPRTVIGVMPVGFRFPEFATLWLPMAPEVQTMAADDRSLGVVGRLASGVTPAAAQVEMEGIAGRLAAERPETYLDWTARVGSLRQDMTKDESGQGFLLALAASGFVLLIACANLANLFLARATSRARELAVRVSLGASRARIAGHLLAESTLLGLAGGLLGLVLSLWGVRLVTGLIGSELPFWLVLTPDWRLLAFTFLLAVFAGVAFGLTPALKSSRIDLNEVLKTGGAGATTGRRENRLRGALVVAQVALAIVLLAGAGITVKTFLLARSTAHLQYDPKAVLAARLTLDAPKYEAPGLGRLTQDQLLERLHMQPMVEAVAAEQTDFLGTFLGTASRVTLDGQTEPLAHADAPRFQMQVTPEYLAVMGMPIARGRGIAPQDGPGTEPVAVVAALTAARLWPDQNPLEKRLRIGDATGGRWITVVGVLAEEVRTPASRGNGMLLYTPLAQSPAAAFRVLIRFRGDAPTMATTLRAVASTVDPDEPVEAVMTLEQGLFESIKPIKVMVGLLGFLGGIALLLSAFGIYGVMSYIVARSGRELGIRMALGAEVRNIHRHVVGRGLRLALLGLLIGLPSAFGLTRLLRRVLVGVSSADPAVFVSVSLLLAGIAVVACWLPARRATRVDPLIALRAE